MLGSWSVFKAMIGTIVVLMVMLAPLQFLYALA